MVENRSAESSLASGNTISLSLMVRGALRFAFRPRKREKGPSSSVRVTLKILLLVFEELEGRTEFYLPMFASKTKWNGNTRTNLNVYPILYLLPCLVQTIAIELVDCDCGSGVGGVNEKVHYVCAQGWFYFS